jgi:hypothetical protein
MGASYYMPMLTELLKMINVVSDVAIRLQITRSFDIVLKKNLECHWIIFL